MKFTQEVPDYAKADIEAKVKSLNKRAGKLCVPALKMTSTEFTKKVYQDGREKTVLMARIEIEGEGPKLEGWDFFGTIEWTEAGALLWSVPEKEIPSEYRQATRFCDHCKTTRRRTETFVVYNPEVGFRQIGRNCLKDFLGMNVESFLWWFDRVARGMGGEEFWGGGGNGREVFPMVSLVEETMKVLLQNGGRFISRKYVQDRMNEDINQRVPSATSDTVSWFHNLSRVQRPTKEEIELHEVINAVQVSPEDVEACMNFYKAITPLDNFESNLKVSFQREYSSFEKVGGPVFAIFKWMKENGKLPEYVKKDRPAPAVSEHFGAKGEKIALAVTINFIKHLTESKYPCYLVKMEDEAGRTFTWFASNPDDSVQVGAKLNLKATVKDHSEYSGVKQTVLTRCKVVA